MIPKPWRERLAYLAMSVFVAWHTLAIFVAPNSSATAYTLRPIFQPYLSLFRLDSNWAFFAPSAGRHSQFRYVIVGGDGREHVFVPSKELNWYLPTDIWFKNWYYTIIEFPHVFGDFFAEYACRKHADLEPVLVTLQAIHEHNFSPNDHLAGKHPLSREFTTLDALRDIECSSRPASQSPGQSGERARGSRP
jgi:hypothetical protein